MSSKKEQAIELYNNLLLTNPNPSRQDLMKLFQDKLGMTTAGSSTYVHMVKSQQPSVKSSTPVVKSASPKTTHVKPTTVQTDDNPKNDTRQLYSKCFYKDNEVVFISCHFDRNNTLSYKPTTVALERKCKDLPSICIKGVPSDSETLSDIKEKYVLISM